MKKFTKLFLSCAAMAALTAAVATSAMAAGITATYDENNETGTLAIAYDGVTVDPADEVTVLVTTKARDKEITEDDILYIDQKTGGEFNTVTLRQVPVATQGDDEEAGYLPDGTYYVYVGYTSANGFTVLNDSFTLGETGEELMIGDINDDGELDGSDASGILLKGVGKSGTATGNAGKHYKVGAETIMHGDINDDGELDGSDASGVLLRGVGKTGTATGKAGQKVTAVAID